MDLLTYQNEINKLYLFPRFSQKHLEYAERNLVGELGEYQSLFAKYLRDKAETDDGYHILNGEVMPKVKKELGDILFMIVCLIDAYGWKAADIAKENLEKLHGRVARDTLSGSGDDR